MAEYRVEILLPAWEDLNQIADFHMKMVGPASAQKIMDEILDAISKLSIFPLMGSLHWDPVLAQKDYRKVICGNYVCIYKVIGDVVYIYRMVHGATDYKKDLTQ